MLSNLAKSIEKKSCRLEASGKKLCRRLTWFFMLVLNPGHTFTEVSIQEMQHKTKKNKEKNLSHTADAEMVFQAALSYFHNEVDRGKIIYEKNKVLLTVGALLLAATAALAPSIEQKWLILMPLSLIMVSAFLILVHFGVQSVPVPNWNMVQFCQQGDAAKRNLAVEYFDCGDRLGPKNDFRVGVYLASSRAMTIGAMLMIPLIFALATSSSQDERLIKKIKNDPGLQQLLRGPTGPPGPQGQSCSKCDQGKIGVQGSSRKILNQTLPEGEEKIRITPMNHGQKKNYPASLITIFLRENCELNRKIIYYDI